MAVYTYTLEAEQSNITSPYIDGDEKPVADLTYLPSAYAGTVFSVDIEFTLKQFGEDIGPEGTTIPIDNFQSYLISPYTGISFTELTPSLPEKKKLRVSGGITGGSAGSGASYDFVLNQEGYPIINVATNQIPNDFLAITAWYTPTVTKELLNQKYIFSTDVYEFGTGTTVTVEFKMSQYVYWNWTPDLIAFKQLVGQGVL